MFLLLALIAAAGRRTRRRNTGFPQQINDFPISGYGDKGKKSWDVSGKSADIFEDKVNLDDVKGNLYGEGDNVKLTADKGVFHREAEWCIWRIMFSFPRFRRHACYRFA